MNKEIKFFENKESENNAKFTVRKSGMLGISKGAESIMKIKTKMYLKFGTLPDGRLIVTTSSQKDSASFKISKAGTYYYVSVKYFLIDIGVDVKKKHTQIFDLVKTELPDVFEMKYRIVKKK